MSSAYKDGLTDIDPESRYVCPECKYDYSGRYIKRHLVKEHDYRYYDGHNVYKPEEEATHAE